MEVTKEQTKGRGKRPSKPAAKPKFDMDQVLTLILQLMTEHELDRITFTLVSREAKIPRSTLYYYFGNSRLKMIDEAFRLGMQIFTQLYSIADIEKYSSWRDFQLARMKESARLLFRYPWAADLYFRYRPQPGMLGETIRHSEQKYFEQFSRVWAKFNGTVAPEHAIRYTSYLKIGIFYGLSFDRGNWNHAEGKALLERYLEDFTDFVTDQMKRDAKPLEKR